jgi:hypothetical protein
MPVPVESFHAHGGGRALGWETGRSALAAPEESTMPVSKKRKKEGKPVQRKAAAPEGGEHPHGPEEKLAPQERVTKPSNPFVAQQQSRRASQRGR